MRVGFCQFDIAYKNVEKNLETIETMLHLVEADIIVLPELALTGYYFEDKQELMKLSSDAINAKVFRKLQAIAKTKSMVIVIGLGEVVEDKLYNTAYIIDDTGVVGKHRKMHLTNIEGIFTPGDVVEVFEVKGIKLGVAVCFDTWFPELFRKLTNLGVELICCPANFGGPWTLDVVRVRALENVVPVILSNRLGSEIIHGEKDYFRGESMIVDGYGNPLLRAYDQPYTGIVDLDLKAYDKNVSLISKNMVLERQKHDKK